MKSIMTKRVMLAALFAGSGVLAASAFAMNGAADGKPGCEMRHGQAMQAKMAESWDARLAALKAKLKLAPAQTAAWQTFTDANKVQPHPQMAERKAMREAYAKMNTPQRVDAMLARANTRHAHQVTRAHAVKALYAQLTPAQQAVFDSEAMALSGHGMGGQGHHGHHGRMHQPS